MIGGWDALSPNTSLYDWHSEQNSVPTPSDPEKEVPGNLIIGKDKNVPIKINYKKKDTLDPSSGGVGDNNPPFDDFPSRTTKTNLPLHSKNPSRLTSKTIPDGITPGENDFNRPSKNNNNMTNAGTPILTNGNTEGHPVNLDGFYSFDNVKNVPEQFINLLKIDDVNIYPNGFIESTTGNDKILGDFTHEGKFNFVNETLELQTTFDNGPKMVFKGKLNKNNNSFTGTLDMPIENCQTRNLLEKKF